MRWNCRWCTDRKSSFAICQTVRIVKLYFRSVSVCKYLYWKWLLLKHLKLIGPDPASSSTNLHFLLSVSATTAANNEVNDSPAQWLICQWIQSKLFLFSNKAHLNSRVSRTVIGIALCHSHQACSLFYLICMKLLVTLVAFTFTFLEVIVASDLSEENYWRIWLKKTEKKTRIGGFAYPYFTPSWKPRLFFQIFVRFRTKGMSQTFCWALKCI